MIYVSGHLDNQDTWLVPRCPYYTCTAVGSMHCIIFISKLCIYVRMYIYVCVYNTYVHTYTLYTLFGLILLTLSTAAGVCTGA